MGNFSVTLGSLGARLSRRDLLRIGLPAIFASPVQAARPRGGFGTAKSVLVVFASGGQSQFETYDPKPDAPEEIRGEFGSIPTTVPGLRFCEHLPKLAKLAHRFTVVKSVMHDDLDHGSAVYLSLTGRFHQRKSSNPDPHPNDYPAHGAVLKRVRPAAKFPHTAIHVNGPLLVPEKPSPGLNGGFLGRGFDPFIVGDPTDDNELTGGLGHHADVPVERFDSRRKLLEELESHRVSTAVDHGTLVNQAYDVLKSPQARSAFDLSQESATLRDRYGRHRPGQACLLARRLVEAGVPWVTAFFNYTIRGQDKHPDDTDVYGWDTHNDIFDAMKTHLLPRWDATFSVLLEDLHQRGLLETTLVVGMGEFGRAPKVALEPRFAGATPGRKHWAGCYSIILAGAGVTPGAVYGASDRIGAYPSDRPVSPCDLTATLFHALGIKPGGHYEDAAKRPSIISEGEVMVGLWK